MIAMLLVLAAHAALPDEPADLTTLRARLQAAKPGDTVTLAAGTLTGSLMIEDIKGLPGKPITVRGAGGDNPTILRARDAGEVFHFVRCSHLTLADFTIEDPGANGLNVDDGGVLTVPAEGVTLRGITVRGKAAEGIRNAIKLSGLKGFTVEGCTVETWGSDGSAIDLVGCRDGVISGCTVRRASGQAATGIQMKGGSRDITVRGCHFSGRLWRGVNIGGSTGLQFFRPKPEGFEARGITVEGCTFDTVDAAASFAGADACTFRFNTIYHPQRWALRILQETRSEGFVPCRKGVVTDNIIVFGPPVDGRAPTAVNVGDATDAASFTFARNVWFSDGDARSLRLDLPSEEKDGVIGKDPKLKNPAKGDFTPAKDGPGAKSGAGALPKR